MPFVMHARRSSSQESSGSPSLLKMEIFRLLGCKASLFRSNSSTLLNTPALRLPDKMRRFIQSTCSVRRFVEPCDIIGAGCGSAPPAKDVDVNELVSCVKTLLSLAIMEETWFSAGM